MALMRDLVMPVAVGLALFIFGMQVMRIGFEHLFLHHMKRFLARATQSPFTGLLAGALATAILQSSSAITLLTIALTQARILSFRQALGIVLGTNIGTSFTTELLAISLPNLEVILFSVGAILFMIPKSTLRSLGLSIGGLGLLFMGMNTIRSISISLQQYGWFDSMFMYGQESIIQGVLAGTVVTAIIQSSTTVTAMAMSLVAEQLLPLSTALAIVLGSNIGTCATALIASIGTQVASRQVALSHVVLNVGGVLLFYPFIDLFSTVVQHLADDPMQQVAHAQTLFNVLSSLLVLPFVRHFEAFIIWITPQRKKRR